jgi:hypothetical protein
VTNQRHITPAASRRTMSNRSGGCNAMVCQGMRCENIPCTSIRNKAALPPACVHQTLTRKQLSRQKKDKQAGGWSERGTLRARVTHIIMRNTSGLYFLTDHGSWPGCAMPMAWHNHTFLLYVILSAIACSAWGAQRLKNSVLRKHESRMQNHGLEASLDSCQPQC